MKRQITLASICFLAMNTVHLSSSHASETRADVGIDIAYTGDYFHNTTGGIRTGSTYLDLFEIAAFKHIRINEQWQLTANISGIATNGNSLSEDLVGDVQVASNLEGGGRFRKLATANVEISNQNFSALVGLYDINTEFDVLDNAGLFINSAHGIGSEIALTGENGPSIYPFYSMALRLQWQWNDANLIRFAIMDGSPGSSTSNNAPNIEFHTDDGYFSVVEYQRQQKSEKLLIGAWQYSKSIPRDQNLENSLTESGNFGIYARYEDELLEPSTNGFLRIGYADSDFNQFDWYLGLGISKLGILDARPNDTVGIALAYLRNDRNLSSSADGAQQASHETNIELTYQVHINDNIFLQPNIQYILNPGAVYSDSFITGLRFSFSYDY